jgi:hypothetical protein
MTDIPNMARTKAALEAYDAEHARPVPMDTKGEAKAYFDGLDRLAQAVGEAYGLDTADRNNLDTCRECVRPGPFVRRMVALWEETCK